LKIVESSMRIMPWLGAMAAVASFGISQAQAQARRFDGTWSVQVLTERGGCDRYRYPVIIENGQARYGGPESFDVNGQVRPNGSITATISRGEAQAHVRGQLSGDTGQGTWSTTGGRVCSGSWNAEKRG
jgi:hypothetical protein